MQRRGTSSGISGSARHTCSAEIHKSLAQLEAGSDDARFSAAMLLLGCGSPGGDRGLRLAPAARE